MTHSHPPTTESELEEILTQPNTKTEGAVSRLEGDILLLGAGGKMGPTLARLARRSLTDTGSKGRVIAVSRFASGDLASRLLDQGIDVIPCDLLDPTSLSRLPDAPNVLFLAGMKFGATSSPSQTWAMNVYLPGLVAERFKDSRIVALSTGNVYPFVPVGLGGATEETLPEPLGEYAQSCLGRERMFEYGAQRHGTPSVLVRLNYANDLRYGVLLDIAEKVYRGDPVDVTMGFVNVIWQGDANAAILCALEYCSNPPLLLNLTGGETVSVRELAHQFGKLFDKKPVITGEEADVALLSNAERYHRLMGPPSVSVETMVEWTANWVKIGGPTLRKPTKFETRDGKF
jgi:nucleoside-diphosphate-sugar epimerase